MTVTRVPYDKDKERSLARHSLLDLMMLVETMNG